MYYSHGDGALYLKAGGWGIVLLGPLFLIIDRKLRTKAWYARRSLVTLAGAIVVSYLLYVPLIFLSLLVLTLLDW